MKTSIKLTISLSAIILIFASCGKPKQNDAVNKTQSVQFGEGYELYKVNCTACHNPNSASHDAIIAPPMIAVKRMYSMKYSTKEDFVKEVVAWASDPKAENSIMKGAVMQYKVMPKQPFKIDDLKKIATYIYDNEIEAPKWFAAHEKAMHGQGRGQGKMEMN